MKAKCVHLIFYSKCSSPTRTKASQNKLKGVSDMEGTLPFEGHIVKTCHIACNRWVGRPNTNVKKMGLHLRSSKLKKKIPSRSNLSIIPLLSYRPIQ